ncbi:hypothetical protein D030_3344B, partial [Vibrio parahaemolyticus AQ3810]
STSLTAQSWNS